MDIKLASSFDSAIENLKVKDVYYALEGDEQADIPFLVWLLENPKSPMPMPGKISLYNHDHLHIILGREQSSEDEAFIVGFTMGNDPKTKWYHVAIFKLFSYFIYPKIYKLNRRQMKVFDLGFSYGRKIMFKKIHKIDFTKYHDYTLSALRKFFGIEANEIQALRQIENNLVPS